MAQNLQLPFFEASFSKFARQLGVNAVGDLPLGDRIDVQEKSLDLYLEELRKYTQGGVTDRTPIDMLAYMLGEVTMHNLPPELGQRVKSYTDRCLYETARNFDTIITVQPLPHYEEDPTKPPPNAAYQWQIQYLIEGAMRSINNRLIDYRLMTSDLESRIYGSCQLLGERISVAMTDKKHKGLH